MKCVDDFRLRFGKKEYVPIVTGGMGVDISTAELALEAARLGGVGHISDAMVNTVADRALESRRVEDALTRNADLARGRRRVVVQHVVVHRLLPLCLRR